MVVVVLIAFSDTTGDDSEEEEEEKEEQKDEEEDEEDEEEDSEDEDGDGKGKKKKVKKRFVKIGKIQYALSTKSKCRVCRKAIAKVTLHPLVKHYHTSNNPNIPQNSVRIARMVQATHL